MSLEIERVEHHDLNDMAARLRRVTLWNQPEHTPYMKAKITFERKKVDEQVPCQTYVLKEDLDRIHNIEWELSRHGINPHDLNGYVKMWIKGSEEPIDYLPPILEWSEFERTMIIADGIHRMYSAYLSTGYISCACISGIPKEYPTSAYPTKKDIWSDMSVFENEFSIPKAHIRRWNRIQNYHMLYRNLNTRGAFENVSPPRE